ncbi:hypothetical protein G6F31_018316 [Rhizopus arrhizus]|nr:hypothetical protein G6F31_018316 [Rhizopus arrhizus]
MGQAVLLRAQPGDENLRRRRGRAVVPVQRMDAGVGQLRLGEQRPQAVGADIVFQQAPQRQGDAQQVDAGQRLAEGQGADQRAQCDHAHVHGCEHQGRVLGQRLVGADIGQDIAEVGQAQRHARQHVAAFPADPAIQQHPQHQHARQYEGQQQAAGKGGAGAGDLLEQDVDHPITRPDHQGP